MAVYGPSMPVIVRLSGWPSLAVYGRLRLNADLVRLLETLDYFAMPITDMHT